CKGPPRLSKPVQEHGARRQGQLQSRALGRTLRARQLALRPRGDVPPQGAQRRLEGDPRRRSEIGARDKASAGSFQEVKPGAKTAGRQAEFESRWDAAAVKNYAEAKALA